MTLSRHALVSVCFLAGPSLVSCGGDDAVAPSPDPEPPRATEITLRPDRLNFDALGESAQVEAVVLDQFGSPMSSAEVAWSTSAAAVASVDGSGLVTAVGVGEASIRASSGGASALTSVTVEQRIAFLAFRSEPEGGTTRGFASPVEVEALDEQRNRVAGSGQPTVTLSVAANEPGGRLLGTTEAQAVDGVAAFESIRFDRIGDGYALAASAGKVTTTSGEFSVEIPVCDVPRSPPAVPVAAGGDYVQDDAAVPELPGSVIQVDGQDALDIGGVGGRPSIVGDFNGDGRQDLAYSSSIWPPVETALPYKFVMNQGDGTFDLHTSGVVSPAPPTFVHPSGVVVGDFDGDGRDDLFVAATGLDRDPFPGEPNGLMVSSGTGLTDVGDRLPVRDGFTHSGAAGDLECDGDLDLFVGNISNAPSDLLVNDGSASFSVASGVIPSVWRDEPEDISGGDTDALDVEMSDLDGDGFPELVLGMVLNDGSVGIVVLWNNGTGDYSNAVESVFPAPAGFPLNSQVKVVDIDGDGDQDVVAAFTTLDHQGFALQVLRNDGERTLTEATVATSPASSWIQEMFPVDLENDGDVDFSMFSFPERFLVNDGSGNFTPRGLDFLGLEQTFCVHYLVPIDADGDGLTEFIGQGESHGHDRPPGHYHCLFRK